MKYVEWVEAVWRALCEQAYQHPFPDEATIDTGDLSISFRLDPSDLGHEDAVKYVLLDELPRLSLVERRAGFNGVRMSDWGLERCGRALAPYYAPEPGRELPEEEQQFLSKATAMMEERHDRYAYMGDGRLSAADIFAALGWDWDGMHAIRLARSLERRGLVTYREFPDPTVDVRPTYVGVLYCTGAE